jgi:hypothetical protein
MPLVIFLSLASWSVECAGLAYDDARQTKDGVWYFRHVITGKITCFSNQNRVVPLFNNPR